MADSRYPILCMGTFISLVFAAKNRRTGIRSTESGTNDGLSNPDIFAALLQAIDPGFKKPEKGQSFKVITSGIKNCSKNKSEYYSPSNLKLCINERVNNDYDSLLQSLRGFVDEYMDRDGCFKSFPSAVVYLIQQDCDGKPEDEFLVSSKKRLKRQDISNLSRLSFEEIIVSVCHYIFNNVSVNRVGRATIENWNSTYQDDDRVLLDSLAKQVKLEFLTKTKDNDCGYLGSMRMSEIPQEYIERGQKYIEKLLSSSSRNSNAYFKHSYNHYSSVRTLLYNEQPKFLYDFFVCNTIRKKIPGPQGSYYYSNVDEATIPKLISSSRYIILSAVGGMGKSIMIRHLFLDAIANYEDYGLTPFLITLKDYKGDHLYFEEYIYEKYQDFGGKLNESQFSNLLEKGHCVFLLDGLDEISAGIIKTFEDRFFAFLENYNQNYFIISSRPTDHYVKYSRFAVMELLPFNLLQAVSLIEKLEFRQDEPDIKKHFISDIKDRLFVTHREFASNPLLLTIMLLTYEQHGDIPSKMHFFYQRAYMTLAEKHDASKGGFRRRFKTKLTSDRLADYLAEFCARSYYKELIDFSENEFSETFNQLTVYKEDGRRCSSSDFAEDLIKNVCLMYFETEKYHFMHRSFQEYFCALYYSRQKDKSLLSIANSFEKKHLRSEHDQTFGMLYDMIPEKIEEYVFIPVLSKVLEIGSTKNEMQDYWLFLRKQHPQIEYEDGETFDVADNDAMSFLYNFIVETKNIKGIITDELMSSYDYDEFIVERYCYYDPDYRIDYDKDGWVHASKGDQENLVEYGEVPYEYKDLIEDPEIVGYAYAMNLKTVYNNQEKYCDIINELSDYDFPLRKEYMLAKAYLAELKAKYKHKHKEDEEDSFKAMLDS